MEENMNLSPMEEERIEEIRILDLLRELLGAWKTILKWAAVFAVVGIVITVSLPNEYTVTTKMVPETAPRNTNVNTLANIAGISLAPTTTDAFSPSIFPEIVKSNPFVTDLFPVEVSYKLKKESVNSDYYTYMRDFYREPWWKAVIKAPAKFFRWIKSLFTGKSQPVVGYENLNLSRLTSEQSRVASRIRQNIQLDYKSSVLTLKLTAQDPSVAARISAEVVARLQEYVTNYRTEKSRKTLEYHQKLYEEYKDRYYDSQQRYARYVDSHQNIILQSVRIEQERLQNEMNLNYQLFNSCAQQLQAAQAKVQEETPVLTVINPPATPLSPSAPKRGLLIVAFIFLGVVFSALWILLGRGWVKEFKEGPHVAE